MTWHREALCVGAPSDVFFPPRPHQRMWDQARQICAQCPVSAECLEDALANEPEYRAGMYGGKTPRERDVIARERQRGTT